MQSGWRLMAFQLGQLGFAIALCLIGGLLVGVWADQSLGTSPLFTLSGSLLGITVGSYLAYRSIASAIAMAEQATKQKGGGPPEPTTANVNNMPEGKE